MVLRPHHGRPARRGCARSGSYRAGGGFSPSLGCGASAASRQPVVVGSTLGLHLASLLKASYSACVTADRLAAAARDPDLIEPGAASALALGAVRLPHRGNPSSSDRLSVSIS